jgi:hypothetical protein
VDEIEYVITRSATPRVTEQVCGDDIPGESVPNNVYGWGRVDALAAITGDADGDLTSNLDDCRPADWGVWSAPGPATGLTLAGAASTTFTWLPPVTPGGADYGYSLLRATDPADFSTASCLAASGGSAVDDMLPESAYFYLVQVESACGRTTGAGTGLALRATVACP